MRKILATLSSDGDIGCHEKDCIYKKECANHVSAGDYRSEGGFSPKISIDPVGVICCESIDANPIYEEHSTVPINHDELDRGEVYLDKKDGKIKSRKPLYVPRVRDRCSHEWDNWDYDYEDYNSNSTY